jgi:hypothetical protein
MDFPSMRNPDGTQKTILLKPDNKEGILQCGIGYYDSSMDKGKATTKTFQDKKKEGIPYQR